jgi:hypothetical protein
MYLSILERLKSIHRPSRFERYSRRKDRRDPNITKGGKNPGCVQVSLKAKMGSRNGKNKLAYFFHKWLSICPNLK